MTVLWRKVEDHGELRPAAYPGDAGLDMAVSRETLLPVRCTTLVPCGIQVALPPGVAAVVMARSSTTVRNLLIFSTIIDQGYRGDLYVFVHNLNDEEQWVHVGERIAQLLPILVLADSFSLQQVPVLPPSVRGERGFGSSGR